MRCSVFVLLLFLSGCARDVEIAPYGPYAPCRDVRWVPKCPEVSPHFGVDPPFCDKDPQPLCKLIDVALRNNPQTLQSWAAAEAAYFFLKESESAYYPTIDGIVSYGAINSNGGGSQTLSSVPLKTNFLLEEATLNWLLLDFGGRECNVEAQKQALIASNWTHNQTLQQVVFNVVQGYYQALATDEEVTAREADLKDAKTAEDSAKAQFAAGIANIVDALQSEANRWKAEIALQTAYGDRANAYAILAEAVGIPPETNLRLVPLPRDLTGMRLDESLCDLIARSKLERDDLNSLMASYFQAKAQVGVATSGLFPTIEGTINLTKTYFQRSFVRRTHSYESFVTLNWTIFDGFSTAYSIYQAKALEKEAFANWKIQEQMVVLNVIEAYTQFETSKENLTSASEYLRFAQEAYNATLAGYRAGINTITDLLNSMATLADARLQEIQSRSGILTAAANLSFATGTLFQINPCQ